MVEGYSWAPPGLSPNRVEEYMRQLPVEKVPRLGSVGERYRDHQLGFQLPKQDLSAKYCTHLEHQHQVWLNYQLLHIQITLTLKLDQLQCICFCSQRCCTRCWTCSRALQEQGQLWILSQSYIYWKCCCCSSKTWSSYPVASILFHLCHL